MIIGDPLPAFEMKGTDQKTHSHTELAAAKATVVIFTCNHCPYALAYVRRIASFVQRYGPKGVAVIAINPNDEKRYPQDAFEKMPAMAERLALGGLYLRDDSQETARAFEAQRTPEAYVFDGQQRLVYTGAIDDNHEDEGAVENRYLIEAVESVLAGRPVETEQTQAVGCSIKWLP